MSRAKRTPPELQEEWGHGYYVGPVADIEPAPAGHMYVTITIQQDGICGAANIYLPPREGFDANVAMGLAEAVYKARLPEAAAMVVAGVYAHGPRMAKRGRVK